MADFQNAAGQVGLHRCMPLKRPEYFTCVLHRPDVARSRSITARHRADIYALLARRALPAFKVGGQWRFQHSDLDAWVRQQTVQSPKPRKGKR